MISLAEDADEEYGRRLKEGLANAPKGGSSRKTLGNKDGDKAPEKAVQEGHEAEPY
jgi:catalase